jgi:hypothetical protein
MFLVNKKLDEFDLAALCFLSAHITRVSSEKPKEMTEAGALRSEIKELPHANLSLCAHGAQ